MNNSLRVILAVYATSKKVQKVSLEWYLKRYIIISTKKLQKSTFWKGFCTFFSENVV